MRRQSGRRRAARARSRRSGNQHVWIHRRGGDWTFKSGVFRARVVEGDCNVKFSVSALTPSGSFFESGECSTVSKAKKSVAKIIAREHRNLGAQVLKIR